MLCSDEIASSPIRSFIISPMFYCAFNVRAGDIATKLHRNWLFLEVVGESSSNLIIAYPIDDALSVSVCQQKRKK